jgi:hypothetical protein
MDTWTFRMLWILAVLIALVQATSQGKESFGGVAVVLGESLIWRLVCQGHVQTSGLESNLGS